MDELTRAIVEALAVPDCGCRTSPDRPAGGDPFGCYCDCANIERRDDCDHDKPAKIAAALAPLIEARVREARADALTEVADSLYVSATNVERANGGGTERTKFMREMVDVLRRRAKEVRR